MLSSLHREQHSQHSVISLLKAPSIRKPGLEACSYIPLHTRIVIVRYCKERPEHRTLGSSSFFLLTVGTSIILVKVKF